MSDSEVMQSRGIKCICGEESIWLAGTCTEPSIRPSCCRISSKSAEVKTKTIRRGNSLAGVLLFLTAKEDGLQMARSTTTKRNKKKKS